MDFKEYTGLALLTESIKQPLTKEVTENTGLTNRMLHSIIGITTEDFELDLAKHNNDIINALEEMGDKLYYMATLADELNLTDLLQEENSDTISILENDMLDLAKRSLFYGTKFDIDMCGRILYSKYIDTLNNIKHFDSNVEVVMRTNILKLQQRYPNKFTSRDATIRDLKAERKILEDNLSK